MIEEVGIRNFNKIAITSDSRYFIAINLKELPAETSRSILKSLIIFLCVVFKSNKLSRDLIQVGLSFPTR